MQEILFFSIPVLIMSVVIHEVSHGYVADILGDQTARFSGRLTLNPLKHLDPFGSIIFPAMLVLFNSPIVFGWAKPVPYNPYNLKNGKYGPGLVALAGPLSNIVLAVVFALLIRIELFSTGVLPLVGGIIFINLILAFFNLIPIPPLDGSKVIASFLPYGLYQHWRKVEDFFERYGLLVLFLFLYFASQVLFPYLFVFVAWLFTILSGAPIEVLQGM